MNTSLLVIMLVLAAIESSRCSLNDPERSLRKLLARWRSGDVAGLPWEMPPMDRLDFGPLSVENDGFKLELSNVMVRGLERMTVERLAVERLAGERLAGERLAGERLEGEWLAFVERIMAVRAVRAGRAAVVATLSVPALYVIADEYRLKGEVFMFPINDRGIFQVRVSDVRVTVALRVSLGGVRWLHVDYSTGRVEAYLSGSGDLIRSGVASAVDAMLRDKDSAISAAETAIKAALNGLLAKFSLQQILDAIDAI